MPTPIARPDLVHLLEDGGQLVEVLPRGEFEDEHLAGAVNKPLKHLDAEAVDDLDPTRPVVVYCWDSL